MGNSASRYAVCVQAAMRLELLFNCVLVNIGWDIFSKKSRLLVKLNDEVYDRQIEILIVLW